MNTATPSTDDIKSYIMEFYQQLPVTEDNSRAVRAAAWALLANVLISDYLNRWNEARTGGKGEDDLLTDAEIAVRKALNIDDTFALAHYANGLILRACNRHKEAVEAFDRAIKSDQTFVRAYAQKGSELINDGQLPEALAEIKKAIDADPEGKNPSSGMFYWNRGRAYFFQGKYEQAIEPLNKALDLRKNLWHIALYLASAYWKSGDQENAKKTLQEFLNINLDFTFDKVISYEKANPTDNKVVTDGRDVFHKALKDTWDALSESV